ncbi:MAG: decarboxylase [Candidatus Nanoarchaeia archaeon]|nr:decarboxylase [Candidatus Nanoarchaeia archaeon]
MMDKAHFEMSKSKIIENYNEIKSMCDAVSYSFKTNNKAAEILEQETDSWFSVHFIDSIKKLHKKDKIWFIAQAWNKEELDSIFKEGVNKFIVDNEMDLEVLLEYIKENKKNISLLLRMRLKEKTVHTGKYFVYGMYSHHINRLIPELRNNSNIEKVGIHFHRKTQNIGEWNLKEELKSILTEETVKCLDVVNIGGGIPAEYKNYRPEIKNLVFEKIKELKEWLDENNIKMIIEPGRYIVASAVKLIAEIKNIYDNNIIINCSVYNSAMDTFVANIRLLVENEKETGTPYTIKGCTPDSMDIFRYKVFLENPKIGDKLVFLNAGAYTYSTDFCNLPKLETVIID